MMSTAAQRVAFERSEALFERRGVGEIREIEKATLKQIDDKKRKLREIVGESYDDVITSADAIVGMSVKCQSISNNLEQLRRRFSADGLQLTGSQAAAPAAGVSQLDELHAIGSRVKYLLDTPELIYSCLDSGDFLEASRRWLKSRIVFDCLQEQAPKQLLAKFPVLQHMWPNVERLRAQVVEQIKQHLCRDCRMTARTAASCLAALASLQGSQCLDALEVFLSSRISFVADHLEIESADNSLLDLTLVIQNVVYHVGELFCGTSIASGRVARQSCKLEDVVAAEDVGFGGHLFGAVHPGDGNTDDSLIEETLWKAEMENFKANMSVLTIQSAAERCSSWLSEIAQLVMKNSSFWFGSCKSLQKLSLMEKTVDALVDNWNLSKDGLGSKDNIGEGGDGVTWKFIVRESLGMNISIWDDIFENPFRSQALELVEAAFQDVQHSAETDLEVNLAEIQSKPSDPLGAGGQLIWLPVTDFLEKLLDPVSLQALPGNHDSWDSRMGSDALLRSKSISSSLDEKVLESLQGVVDLLEGSDQLGEQDEPLGTRRSLHSLAPMSSVSSQAKSPRKLFLEPRIRDICEAASVRLCSTFKAKLKALAEAGESVSVVESSLLIGMLSLDMADSSGALPAFMGSPDLWKSHIACGSETPAHSARMPSSAFFTPRSARSRPDQYPTEAWALKDQFRSVGLQGYHLWAKWASRGLAKELSLSWCNDEVLTQKEALQSWEEIVISSVDETGEIADEMRFSLPSCPSGVMMTCLLASCREMQRVGGHNAIHEALQLFEWELGNQVCSTLLGLLKDDSPFAEKLGEVGMLQLLLDIRLLRDMLAGGLPLSSLENYSAKGAETEKPERRQRSVSRLSSRSSGVINAMTDHTAVQGERKKTFSAVEAVLSDRLDPIDWATYEPHLWTIEERFYQRSSVIFGVLMQLNPTLPGASVKLPPSAETNLMNLVPVVPRFQYLPVRAPSSQKRHAGSLAGQSVVDAMTNNSLPIDHNGSYSFSDIGMQKSSGQTMDQGTAESSTFSGFQAKLGTAALGSLGSMIGDKAAEVSALAQQQFGDLTSGVGTSWLSTLSFKGMTRPEQLDRA